MLFVTKWIEENKTKSCFFFFIVVCALEKDCQAFHIRMWVYLYTGPWIHSERMQVDVSEDTRLSRLSQLLISPLPEEMVYLNYFYLLWTWRNLDNGRADIHADLGARASQPGTKIRLRKFHVKNGHTDNQKACHWPEALGTKWPSERQLSRRVSPLPGS